MGYLSIALVHDGSVALKIPSEAVRVFANSRISNWTVGS